jgi:hypothetical protein
VGHRPAHGYRLPLTAIRHYDYLYLAIRNRLSIMETWCQYRMFHGPKLAIVLHHFHQHTQCERMELKPSNRISFFLEVIRALPSSISPKWHCIPYLKNLGTMCRYRKPQCQHLSNLAPDTLLSYHQMESKLSFSEVG